MATRHRKQPNILKPLEELLDRLVNDTTTFPKLYKFNIGDKIINICLEMLSTVYQINRAETPEAKIGLIETFEDHLDMAKMLIRFANEKQFIPIKRQGRTAIVVEDITIQITAWKNYITKQADGGKFAEG